MPPLARKARPPHPADVLTELRSALVRRVSQAALVFNGLLVLSLTFREFSWVDAAAYACTTAVLLIALFFTRRSPRLAGGVVVVGFMSLVTWVSWHREGLLSGTTSGALATAIVFAVLLWSPRGAYLAAGIGAACAAILAWWAPHLPANPLRSWAEITALLFTVATFVHASLRLAAQHVRAAQASDARFVALVESSPHGVVWMDALGQIRLMNPAAELLIGVSFAQGEGRSLQSLAWLSADSRVEFARWIDSALGPVVPPALLVQSHRGDSHLELRIGRLREEGQEAGGLLTITNVSERVAAEAAKAQLRGREERTHSLEALGRLAGGVAHDFNNFLTVIVATAEVLEQSVANGSLHQKLAREIVAAAERAAELTQQLLAFGRKQVLEPRVSCLNAVVERLQPLLERLLPETIALDLHCAEDLGSVRVDIGRLEQVIVNLATNAAQAMPNGGSIRIVTANAELSPEQCADNPEAKPGPYVQLTVQDEGCGMDPPTLARVFEPFFTLGKPQGSGLGLSTTHGIVLQSRGVIAVQSVKGSGTSVSVSLPRVERQPNRMNNAANCTSKRAVGPALKILLVEDQQDVRLAVEQMLQLDGHQVHSCEDGQVALAEHSASIEQFDLLITDLVMPGLSGRELAAELHGVCPSLPVLFISGYSDDAAVQQGNWKAEGEFLAKPFNRVRLGEAIARLLASE